MEAEEQRTAAAVAAAVEAEREACARLVETVPVVLYAPLPGMGRETIDLVRPHLAAAIRARGNG